MDIGKHHTLTVSRLKDFGAFLSNDEGEEVLLPKKYIPKGLEEGNEIEVFVYLDHEERPVATTLNPKIRLGQFAFLKVAQVSSIGAFMDWGLEKQLLVPFIEQKERMLAGKSYVVYLYEDKLTQRLAASSKVKQFLQPPPNDLKENQQCRGLVYRLTQLGVEVIVDDTFLGLLYHTELLSTPEVGDELTVYVKKIREDGKVDLSIKPTGYLNHIDNDSQLVLNKLEENQGFLALHDKSTPDEIVQALGLSKKAFKKALGKLYREGKVSLETGGVRLKQ